RNWRKNQPRFAPLWPQPGAALPPTPTFLAPFVNSKAGLPPPTNKPIQPCRPQSLPVSKVQPILTPQPRKLPACKLRWTPNPPLRQPPVSAAKYANWRLNSPPPPPTPAGPDRKWLPSPKRGTKPLKTAARPTRISRDAWLNFKPHWPTQNAIWQIPNPL